MTSVSEPNYEKLPTSLHMDETDINIRAYFSRMSDDKLREYNPEWSDGQVIEWDGNFRSDGALMLVCCERNIEIEEYRQILEEHMKLRNLAPPQTTSTTEQRFS
ncbi:MAG: hypothetical protein M2R45_02034 [Verrucomicrobia subdivision 3 bacterium]|nr:hypothetical protein [Limisphaerales bacterium]MCS1414853.1 hypothetical protein [Limisphaerales bacterium]